MRSLFFVVMVNFMVKVRSVECFGHKFILYIFQQFIQREREMNLFAFSQHAQIFSLLISRKCADPANIDPQMIHIRRLLNLWMNRIHMNFLCQDPQIIHMHRSLVLLSSLLLCISFTHLMDCDIGAMRTAMQMNTQLHCNG